MIYKLTLLRDLPEAKAGFDFYLRGGLASHDGEEWCSRVTQENHSSPSWEASPPRR